MQANQPDSCSSRLDIAVVVVQIHHFNVFTDSKVAENAFPKVLQVNAGDIESARSIT